MQSKERSTIKEATNTFQFAHIPEFRDAIEEWSGSEKSYEGQVLLIETAQAFARDPSRTEDKSAALYLFQLLRNIVGGEFWKFLGPSGTFRAQRINNEDADKEFLSEAWEPFLNALKLIKLDFSSEKKLPLGALEYYLGRQLNNNAISLNRSRGRKGMTGALTADEAKGLQYASYEAHFENHGFDDDDSGEPHDSNNEHELSAFDLENWSTLSEDADLDDGKFPTMRDVLGGFLTVLSEANEDTSLNVNRVVETLHKSVPDRPISSLRVTVHSRLKDLWMILENNGVDQPMFARLLKNHGPVVLAQTL